MGTARSCSATRELSGVPSPAELPQTRTVPLLFTDVEVG